MNKQTKNQPTRLKLWHISNRFNKYLQNIPTNSCSTIYSAAHETFFKEENIWDYHQLLKSPRIKAICYLLPKVNKIRQ